LIFHAPVPGSNSKSHGSPFTSAVKGPSPIVTLVVTMNKDGTPAKAEIKDQDRYSNDPNYRAVADAAHRAIMNPCCHPWPLSPEKYESWKTMTFNFDPRDY
jgi:hypothetical protein